MRLCGADVALTVAGGKRGVLLNILQRVAHRNRVDVPAVCAADNSAVRTTKRLIGKAYARTEGKRIVPQECIIDLAIKY